MSGPTCHGCGDATLVRMEKWVADPLGVTATADHGCPKCGHREKHYVTAGIMGALAGNPDRDVEALRELVEQLNADKEPSHWVSVTRRFRRSSR